MIIGMHNTQNAIEWMLEPIIAWNPLVHIDINKKAVVIEFKANSSFLDEKKKAFEDHIKMKVGVIKEVYKTVWYFAFIEHDFKTGNKINGV